MKDDLVERGEWLYEGKLKEKLEPESGHLMFCERGFVINSHLGYRREKSL